jgi:inner membrane protein
MVRKRTDPKRQFYNQLGIWLSSSYLLLTIVLKGFSYMQFQTALHNIEYNDLETRPSPMNTILWSANVDTKEAYLLGNYSFFDTKPIVFQSYPKNHHLLGDLIHDERIQRMIKISKGWFIITSENGQLYFNDLRFGLFSLEPGSTDFVFKYRIDQDSQGNVELSEVTKDQRDGKKMVAALWSRIAGN